MAGHSKWSQIKHKKAITDAKKGKAFTKLIKEITVAARDGGGDPAGNPRLRTLLEKAKEINMPQDNSMRAIKKGTGELPGSKYEQLIYEGYGPFGIAVIVDTLSDNKNRTIGVLRHLFSKFGGNISETGSVNWMFDLHGVIRMRAAVSEDMLIEQLLDFNIVDIRYDEALYTILCEPKSLETLKKYLVEQGYTIESSDLEQVARTPLSLSDEQMDKAVEFLTALQDDDDVQNVYTNLA